MDLAFKEYTEFRCLICTYSASSVLRFIGCECGQLPKFQTLHSSLCGINASQSDASKHHSHPPNFCLLRFFLNFGHHRPLLSIRLPPCNPRGSQLLPGYTTRVHYTRWHFNNYTFLPPPSPLPIASWQLCTPMRTLHSPKSPPKTKDF